MKRTNWCCILFVLLFSCSFFEGKVDNQDCPSLIGDLKLCVISINDSVELVYTTAAGIQNGIAIKRLKKSKMVLSLNTMIDWEEIGLQYDFYPSGELRRQSEVFNGKEINWIMEFEKDGNIKSAKYGYDQKDRSETGASLKYVNGVLDLHNSAGVVRKDLEKDVVFKILNPYEVDSSYFLLLDRDHGVKWKRRILCDSVVISKDSLMVLDPKLIRTQIYIKINGEIYRGEDFMKFDQMHPPFVRAPRILIPKYLTKAV